MLTREELYKKYLNNPINPTELTDRELREIYLLSEEIYNELGEKLNKLKGASRTPYANERKKLRSLQNSLYPELASQQLVSSLQRAMGFDKQVLYNRFRRSNMKKD